MCTERSGRAHPAKLIAGAQATGSLQWSTTIEHAAVLSIGMRRSVTPPAVRVFRGISEAWGLSFVEEMRLLAVPRPVWSRCLRECRQLLSSETLKRIALVARVFEAINILLPPARADAWMRKPNAAFGGASALELMLGEGRLGISLTRRYLLSEIYNW